MPHVVKGVNLAQAFVKSCEAIINHGEKVRIDRKHVQDNGTTELCPAVVVIDKPEFSTIVMEDRAPNPFATLFESMWIMAGDNCVDTLKYFIPRAPDYADNGTHWRAGYGTRLRKVNADYDQHGVPDLNTYDDDNEETAKVIDQIEYIIKTLTKDPSSRRAIMTIWDPIKEYSVGNSKDYPCNIALQFIIRNNKLNLIVKMRSNDVLFGFSGINVYEWTFLQTMLAARLGREIGWYEHHATSFHVYDNMLDKVEKSASAKYELISAPSFLKEISRHNRWNLLNQESYRRDVGLVHKWINNIPAAIKVSEGVDGWTGVNEPMAYLMMYILFKEDKKAFANFYKRVMPEILKTDMYKAVVHYFNRNTKGVDSSLDYMNMKGGKFCIQEVCRKILEAE